MPAGKRMATGRVNWATVGQYLSLKGKGREDQTSGEESERWRRDKPAARAARTALEGVRSDRAAHLCIGADTAEPCGPSERGGGGPLRRGKSPEGLTLLAMPA